MNPFKKHWEKVLLTAALLGLITAGILLLRKISALSEETNAFVRKPSGKALSALDLNPYNHAIGNLTNPVLWSKSPVDLFSPVPVGATPPPSPTNQFARADSLYLLGVKINNFTMKFTAYTEPGKDFQINMLDWERTFVVQAVGDQIKDQFGKTPYFITHFAHKTKTVNVQGIGQQTRDVSELTIQIPNGKPIILPLGEVITSGDPVAWVECFTGPAGAQTNQVRRGQTFGCGTNTYNVVDIFSNQMIIVNPAKPEEKLKIGPKPAPEETPIPSWPVGPPEF